MSHVEGAECKISYAIKPRIEEGDDDVDGSAALRERRERRENNAQFRV
jgi:hypothetical protein